MTLSEMVDFVCGKVSQTEPEDKSVCRLFLQVRHDNLWKDQLWKDSIYSYSQTVTPDGYAATSTWLPTKQVLLCAQEFDHILAVRTALRRLDVETPETFYRSNFDTFSTTGDARQFMDLPRVVWEFDTEQALYLSNDGQQETHVILDTVGSDLITKVRTKQTVPVGSVAFGGNPVTRIDGFSKPSGDGPVSIGLTTVPRTFTVTYTSVGNFTNFGVGIGTNDPTQSTINLTNGQSAIISVAVGQNLSFFFGNPVLGYFFSGYAVVNTFGQLIVRDTPDANGNPGALTFTPGVAGVNPIITIAAGDTNAPLRCRIQPIGRLPNPTTLRLLGKARLGTFEEDNDEPIIPGMDKVLLEFAIGDMWERERQFGFAQQPFARGATLLEQLKKVQTTQQAYNKRLIPSGGYADEWQLNSGVYSVFP